MDPVTAEIKELCEMSGIEHPIDSDPSIQIEIGPNGIHNDLEGQLNDESIAVAEEQYIDNIVMEHGVHSEEGEGETL